MENLLQACPQLRIFLAGQNFWLMDTCLPDWNTQLEAELPLPCQRRSLGVDSELVELLWQNGEVVLQSQTHKKPSYDPNKFKQTCRDPNNPIQDDETVSWIQCPIDEAFEKEFCSKLLSEIPSTTPVQPSKLSGQFERQNLFNFGASSDNPAVPRPYQPDSGLNHPLPPPRYSSLFDGPHENRNMVVIGEIVDPLKGKRIINRQCSAATLGSSHCGSNQVANDLDLSRASSCGIGDGNNYYTWKDCTEREVHEQPIASPSDGSRSSSLWKTSNQSNDTSRHKRKSWNMEESECKSDGTESESAAGNKSSQKSGTRRSRVAEVHNLSERKRRDRINEKMRALQELIPNSNKSDKASVLDEAIEYMKSLQLQLQFMWMGRGMAQSMMLPGMQHYMARLGLGMGPPTLPQIQDLMRLSRFPPMINQPMMRPVTSTAPNQATVVGQTHVLSPVNYQNPMQNPCFPEQYANYMAFNSAQNTSQPINMQPANNNYVLARPSNGNGYTG